MAGIKHWYRPQPHADGDSITLYEHKASSPQHHGDPIADVYAVIARPNNSVLVVADGVNWGLKPRLAARCAVNGCIEHLNAKLHNGPKLPSTTQDIFHIILRSFHTAQRKIIEHGGTTTTLCVAVVVELVEPKGVNKWGLCVVSVGDSLCYVWKNEALEVHEVTSPAHLGKDRNPRDCGGCLGADLGDHPDLSNLCCCFVPIADADVVFVVSDGVSDNFDPILLKEATTEKPQHQLVRQVQLPPGFPQTDTPPTSPVQPPSDDCLPLVSITPEQRQEMSLAKLTQVLKNRWLVKRRLMASDVIDTLISHTIEITDSKRKFLEQYHKEMEGKDVPIAERRIRDREITQQIKCYPGKLDHATIAACRVGKLMAHTEGDVKRGRTPTNSYVMTTAMAEKQMSRQTSLQNYSVRGGSVFYQPNSRTNRTPPSSPSRAHHPRSSPRSSDEKSLVI